MKKLSIFASLAAAAVIFAGCGGGGGGGYVPGPAPGPGPGPAPSYDVLYLDTGFGPAVGVGYNCGSVFDTTGADGSFLFYPGDICTFDLTGYNGTLFDWDPLYITYADGSGVAGIDYSCWSGTYGFTDLDGYFDYDIDDSCDFQF
jgi:hypothetical protein